MTRKSVVKLALLAGYPAASVVGYWGVLAPAGVSRDAIDKLSGAISAAMKRPEVRQRLLDQGVDPAGSGPGEYDRIIRAEIGRRAKVTKQAGIKVGGLHPDDSSAGASPAPSRLQAWRLRYQKRFYHSGHRLI